MGCRGQLLCSLGWSWDSGAIDEDSLSLAQLFEDGNDSGECDAIWHTEDQSLSDGASTTLDLSALTRTVLGSTITTAFLTIKAILIKVTSTTGGELIVGGAAANEWMYPFGAAGDQVSVPIASATLLSNVQWGWAVNTTNKNLKIAASGGAVTYSIAILGTITTSASGSSGT